MNIHTRSYKQMLIYILLIFVLIQVELASGIQKKDIEIEDYFTQSWISSSQISPDGNSVVYTERRWNKDKDHRETDIWMVTIKNKQTKRLTFDGKNKGQIQWNTASNYIYYKASYSRSGDEHPPYDGTSQVWKISLSGNNPIPITQVKKGIGIFRLSEDGNAIYYTTNKKSVTEEWKELKEEFDEVKYGHGVIEFSSVWKLDLTTWRSTLLIDNKRVFTNLAVSPNNQYCALISKPDGTLLSGEGWSYIEIHDLITKDSYIGTPAGWRNSHPAPHGWLGDLSWSSDSKSLAFTVAFDGYPTEIQYIELNNKIWELFELLRPEGVHAEYGLSWKGETRDLCFVGEEKARRRVYCLNNISKGTQEKSKTLLKGDVVVNHYSFDQTGKNMTATFSTPTASPDIYAISSKGNSERLTHINHQIDNWKLPDISIVSWDGANGDKVEGILELPPDFNGENAIPLVVVIHGGPTAASLFQFRFWIYGRGLLPSKGIAVFAPNYRGSTGYGDKFMTDLIGNENDIEVEDILLGVDAMIERGIADPEKLGVMGWSNGGYLTNCIITKDKRFKAASSGAGVLDQVMQWGIEDTPGHVINYMKGLPWEVPGKYQQGSPLYNLDQVVTPTIIHVGEFDERVPVQHSRTLHRALHIYRKVDCELIIYPDEGHGLKKYSHRLAKLKWDIAWFEKYLLEKEVDGEQTE